VVHSRANVQTILVVDDEPGVRAVAAMVLRKQGYLVLEASSGPHALDIVRTADTPIQLLLSDVRMPGMHGYELARILREKNAALKVLLMSGYVDDDGLRQRIDEAGIPLLEKPFRPAALTQEVLAVLADTRMTTPYEVTT
jgi:CheY-like chemotaxis protein